MAGKRTVILPVVQVTGKRPVILPLVQVSGKRPVILPVVQVAGHSADNAHGRLQLIINSV